jgi:hypothetical protein
VDQLNLKLEAVVDKLSPLVEESVALGSPLGHGGTRRGCQLMEVTERAAEAGISHQNDIEFLVELDLGQ